MNGSPSSQEPQQPKREEKNKFEGKIESFYDYAKQNKWDTTAYVVLLLGLILMFFIPFIGSLLVGLIAGLYFSKEIVYAAKNAKQLIYEAGNVRSLVFLGTALAFLIAAPGIFIGAAIVASIKEFSNN
jgi:ABC-type multidrug transport system fused ATPase/permease subunit